MYVAILTPNIRGTWVSCRLTFCGGAGSAIIGNKGEIIPGAVSSRAQTRVCFNCTRCAQHATALKREYISSRGGNHRYTIASQPPTMFRTDGIGKGTCMLRSNFAEVTYIVVGKNSRFGLSVGVVQHVPQRR